MLSIYELFDEIPKHDGREIMGQESTKLSTGCKGNIVTLLKVEKNFGKVCLLKILKTIVHSVINSEYKV